MYVRYVHVICNYASGGRVSDRTVTLLFYPSLHLLSRLFSFCFARNMALESLSQSRSPSARFHFTTNANLAKFHIFHKLRDYITKNAVSMETL
jgi:hypothetical protein